MTSFAGAISSSRSRSQALFIGVALLLTESLRADLARAEIPLGQIVDQIGFGFVDGRPIGFTYLVFQAAPDPTGLVRLQPSLFENIRVTPAFVGPEFHRTAATDSDFPAIAASLTNGIDEWLTVWHFQEPEIMGAGSGISRLESEYFGAAGRPDLIGRHITSISLRVTSYRTVRSVDFVEFTITAYGVPEPASATMGLSLAATIAMCRRQPPKSGGRSKSRLVSVG
jgi:hypothetical protein